MFAQLPPEGSQSNHWKAKVGVMVLVQLPLDALSGSPACASPEIAGRLRLAGRLAGAGAASTRSVTAERTLVDPAAPAAVTRTRSVIPSAAALSACVADIAPGMSLQEPPPLSHCCHW